MRNCRIFKSTVRILIFVFLLTNVIPLFSFVANAASEELKYDNSDSQGLIYSLDSETKTASVSKTLYTAMDKVTIPEKVIKDGETYIVTGIDSNVFFGAENLTSVELPESLTSIGEAAFFSCKNLKNIKLPNSLKMICDYAFSGTGLENINIPFNVEKIGERAFIRCSKLINFIVDPNNKFLSSDKNGVLYNKDKTTLIVYPGANKNSKYVIPDTVKKISDYSFLDNPYIKKIFFLKNIESIGESPFYGCTNLTDIIVDSKNNYFSNDEYTLYNKDKSELIYYYGVNKQFDIPTSVNIIGKYAFRQCTTLEEVNIPNSVTFIDDFAFLLCEKLKHINFPDSIVNIGKGSFTGTYWYEIQPSGLIYIGKVLYSYKETSSQDSEITIEEGTKSIAGGAFGCARDLQSITIPKSVENIGCYSLSCFSLRNIIVEEGNEKYSSDENGVLFNKDKTELIKYPAANPNLKYTIPDSVTKISDSAFAGCTKLKTVEMPQNLLIIGNWAFGGCSNYSNIKIPYSVKSIGEFAFSTPTKITVPASVTDISEYAFGQNMIICGRKNSSAENYSKQYGNKFIEYIDQLNSDIDELSVDNYITLNRKSIKDLKEIYDGLSDDEKKEVSYLSKLEKAVLMLDNKNNFPVYKDLFIDDSVKITAPIGVLPKMVLIEINSTEPSKEQEKKAQRQFGNETSYLNSFELMFKDKDGNQITPRSDYGTVSISVKLSDVYVNADMLSAVCVDSEGNITRG